MAGTKGKVGGRKIDHSQKEHICNQCQIKTSDIIRVKSYNSHGGSSMIWLCKSCKV